MMPKDMVEVLVEGHVAFWTGLQTDHLERLVLGSIPKTVDELVRAYGGMKGVEVVEVKKGCESLANLAEALLVRIGDSQLFLPKLRCLVVDGDLDSISREGDLLIRCALGRKAAGFPLHTLEITKSPDMPAGMVSELREYIEVVTFAGLCA